ncbi:MAG: hypothetical protein PHO16_03055 [Candidatus Cloacimonetes bacterium]|nr:hypothetical protein [Candidatus Cloacimonadota bacterium]
MKAGVTVRDFVVQALYRNLTLVVDETEIGHVFFQLFSFSPSRSGIPIDYRHDAVTMWLQK